MSEKQKVAMLDYQQILLSIQIFSLTLYSNQFVCPHQTRRNFMSIEKHSQSEEHVGGISRISNEVNEYYSTDY